MFVLLNGAFGVGKTTVARRLAADLPRAAIYDPERSGFVLQRVPAFLLGRRGRPDDFQDLPQWRRLIVLGARITRWRADTVIVPMAFSRVDYFAAFAGALARHDTMRVFCLRAAIEVIEQRLAARATQEGAAVDPWVRHRAHECVDVHHDGAFGEPIDAAPSPEIVAAAIRRTLAG